MSRSVPTSENFKEKAKLIRSFLKERCDSDISHGQCLELVSQIFGFRDWNTATAAISNSSPNQKNLPIRTKTIGDFKKALELYPDTCTVDADFEFSLKDLADTIDDLDGPEDTIYQEFSLALATPVKEASENGIVIFKLELIDQSITTTFSPNEELSDEIDS